MAENYQTPHPSSINPTNGYCYITKTFHSLRPRLRLPLSLSNNLPFSITDLLLFTNASIASSVFMIDAFSDQHLIFSQSFCFADSLALHLQNRFGSSLSKGDVAFILLPQSLNVQTFEFEAILKVVETYWMAHMPVLPHIIINLVKSKITDKYDLKSLKTVVFGGTPLGRAKGAGIILQSVEAEEADTRDDVEGVDGTYEGARAVDEGGDKEAWEEEDDVIQSYY